MSYILRIDNPCCWRGDFTLGELPYFELSRPCIYLTIGACTGAAEGT